MTNKQIIGKFNRWWAKWSKGKDLKHSDAFVSGYRHGYAQAQRDVAENEPEFVPSIDYDPMKTNYTGLRDE